MHERIEDEVADVGKNRESNDKTAQGQRERHPGFADPLDHRPCNPFDAPGVFERLGQDRAEHDHHRDVLDGSAEALFERTDERFPVETGQ